MKKQLFAAIMIAIAGWLIVAGLSEFGFAQGKPGSNPAINAGRVEAYVLHDSLYRRDRRIWVYTPPDYDAHRTQPYPLILVFDGDEYRSLMPLPHILDSLVTYRQAPAFIALLIDNSSGAERIATERIPINVLS